VSDLVTPATPRLGEPPGCEEPERDEALGLVEAGRCALLKHPRAVQAMYRALVAEGRRFAETEQGRAWRARLEASEPIARARTLWEATTLNVLEAEPGGALPGALLDMLAHAISRGDLEDVLASHVEEIAAGPAGGEAGRLHA
jgi:hypothetical protein